MLRFGDVRMLGGRVIPTRWTMQPLKKPQNRTVMVIREIAFDIAINADFFTLVNLKRVR